MRKRKAVKKITALVCTMLTVFAFGGCDKTETVQTTTEATSSVKKTPSVEATTQSDSDAPVFMLEKLPEIGGYVDDIICKRRYPETKYTLSPGEDYGRLIPFYGSFRDYHFVDYETGEWQDETQSVAKCGLMTEKGEIIVDAVYDWFSIHEIDGEDYVIELSMSGNLEGDGKKLWCDSKGTWVKETEGSIYFNFNNYEDGYIITTDHRDIDWETSTGSPKVIVYDSGWNKLFEIDNCAPPYEENYADGYFVMNIFTDYSNYEHRDQFVDKKGNIVYEDVHPKDCIVKGKTCAKKDGGLYGIFDVSGKWVVQPTFDEMSRIDNYYIGKNLWGISVYDINGKFVKSVYDNFDSKYVRIYGDRIYIEEGDYDYESGRSYYQYTDLLTEKPIICEETGLPVNQRFDDTEFFYCNDGENTYLVNFEGRTVAKIPGCGNLSKINDNYFRMVEGHWEDDTQKYTVFSFRTFEKVWSDTIVNTGDRVDIWDYTEKFIIKRYTPEEEAGYEFPSNATSDILDVATGKPVLKDVKNYSYCEIDEKAYLFISDGTYTYAYSPDMTLLMKVRNENVD